MDKYIVNGVEIEYDTFDLDNIEHFEGEVQRVSDAVSAKVDGEDKHFVLRRLCDAMQDFFDAVCGEGTALKIFGDRVNVKDIYTAYDDFVGQVKSKSGEFTAQMVARSASQQPLNRAQRREIERNKR